MCKTRWLRVTLTTPSFTQNDRLTIDISCFREKHDWIGLQDVRNTMLFINGSIRAEKSDVNSDTNYRDIRVFLAIYC